MKISRLNRNKKIVELYRLGYSYTDIQKRYKVSSKTISRLVKGIEIKCSMCGTPKGKTKFHRHHPDKINKPDLVIPLCPSCHGKITIKEKQKEKINILPKQPSSFIQKLNILPNPSFSISFLDREKIIKRLLFAGGVYVFLKFLENLNSKETSPENLEKCKTPEEYIKKKWDI